MTTRKKTGIHATCGAATRKDGRTLVCWRSPGHVDSKDEKRRKHFDADTEDTWTS